jgi:polysaccharide deacetylase family protein (PEP-CTERM system associated)
MQNVLTVDVEEWFHVCGAGPALAPAAWPDLPSRVVDNTRDLLAMFDRCQVRATFFVLGWVAARYPAIVGEIAGAGHEIGSHGHWHTRVYDATPETFGADVDQSLAALSAAGVPAVSGFRAPEWSINDRSLWALDVLAGRGFKYDSSMAPLRLIGNPAYPQEPHPRSTAAGTLVEFPPLVGRRLGQNVPLGGGWGLRMAQPPAIRRAIDARNQAGRAVALWVHPWEIDPDPPRVRLPWPQRFAHYFRLSGFKDRLEEILRHGRFGPMGEALGFLHGR